MTRSCRMEDMISWFDIGDINKGAARFDFDKLAAINGITCAASTMTL